jgi:hypothetical protein
MGLDSMLIGFANNDTDAAQERAFVTFASWRKNWHLHKHLVNTYGGGLDVYYQTHFMNIPLSAETLQEIIAAAGSIPLPGDDRWRFRMALEWLRSRAGRTIVYHGND